MKKFLILLAGFMFIISANLSAQAAEDVGSTETPSAQTSADSRLSSRAFFTVWSGTNAKEGVGYETGMDLNYKAKDFFTFNFGGSYEYGNYSYDDNGASADMAHFFVGGTFSLYKGLVFAQTIGVQLGNSSESYNPGTYMEFSSKLGYSFNSSDKDFISLTTKLSYDINNKGDFIVNSSDGFNWFDFFYARTLNDSFTFDFGTAIKSYSSFGDDEFDLGLICIAPSIGFTYTDKVKNVSFSTFFFTDIYIDTGASNETTFDIGGGVSIGF